MSDVLSGVAYSPNMKQQTLHAAEAIDISYVCNNTLCTKMSEEEKNVYV